MWWGDKPVCIKGGCIEATPVAPTHKATLNDATTKGNVNTRDTAYTNYDLGYTGLDGVLYRHESVRRSPMEFVNAVALTNGIEKVWAILKRGYNGTCHNWTRNCLSRMVNRSCFRLSVADWQRNTKGRLDELFRSMDAKNITYDALTV